MTFLPPPGDPHSSRGAPSGGPASCAQDAQAYLAPATRAVYKERTLVPDVVAALVDLPDEIRNAFAFEQASGNTNGFEYKIGGKVIYWPLSAKQAITHCIES